MNTYDENLRESTTKTLDALTRDASVLEQGQLQAQIELYHAKGAALAARDRLDLDEARCAERRAAHQSVQRAHRQADTLLETLTAAKQGNEAVVANVSASFVNLQASADAIMQLASTLGAAFNVASAAMYDTELYRQVARVNEHLNQVANQARYLALQGMEVSGKCAESIVGALADQGKDVSARLAELLDKTGGDLDQSEQAVQASRHQVSEAAGVEFSARGVLNDAAARNAAMSDMLRQTIRCANFDLTVEVVSASQIKLRFSPFKAPFASNGARGAAPPSQGTAYLGIVAQSRANQFNGDQAAQLFGRWDRHSPQFLAVAPGETIVDLKRDVYGGSIRPGVAYCAFLYVELSAEYKQNLGNFGDLVSIASAPFIPQTPLPRIAYGGEADDPRRILLAMAEAGDDDGVAALTAGAARLEPQRDWLRDTGAELDPTIAIRLNAVVPPFFEALTQIIEALGAEDKRSAILANGVAQELVGQLQDRRDWAPSDGPHGAEIDALCSLVEELALQAESACARPSGALQRKDASRRGGLELRCLLIDHATDPSLPEVAATGVPPDFFNMTIAAQVAPTNYIVAERLDQPPEQAVAPEAFEGAACNWYVVTIDDETCDAFGNSLSPGRDYTPFVLAISRSGEAGGQPGPWANQFTVIDHVWRRLTL